MSASVLVAPSILSADLGYLAREIGEVESGGADMIHIDVMDGRFVPNITWGTPVVRAARRITSLPLDVHLMIVEPDRYVEAFAEAGADVIGIHVEADVHAQRTLSRIRELGKRASITLNPQTPASAVEHLLESTDQVLVMSVNPGFGGQKFLPLAVPKIRALRRMIESQGLEVDIEVDGGITEVTAAAVVEAGANVLVAGAAVFGHPERKERIDAIRRAAG